LLDCRLYSVYKFLEDSDIDSSPVEDSDNDSPPVEDSRSDTDSPPPTLEGRMANLEVGISNAKDMLAVITAA
jgi:hypothetical protein